MKKYGKKYVEASKNVDKNLSLEQEYFKLLKQKLNLKDFIVNKLLTMKK